ncbi:MAG: c-type cytochrome [Elusimicrobia bacterium]|nr:c-type cytochrome [Elusimicrobiota bacterium]
MTTPGFRPSRTVALLMIMGMLAARANAEDGRAAERGLALLTRTRILQPAYAGPRLSCENCHLDGGRRASALPLTGAASAFPKYRAREGRVVTLADRVDECFKRSLNGKALPPDSPAMHDILAYIVSISSAGPRVAAAPLKAGPPNVRAGAALYAARCAQCHRKDGAGKRDLDDDPYVEVPPVWGGDSFNIGAGMARLHPAEKFIRFNMPQGAEGSLTDQQARDVAAFMISQPRPDFAAKSQDWPKGGKPEDARY